MWILGTKKFLLLALVCIFVILPFLFFNKEAILINTDKEPPLTFGQITREQTIKHIEWAYRNDKPYQQFALTRNSPKDFALTFYQPNIRDLNAKREEVNGGVIVFKINAQIPEIFWEGYNPVSLTMPEVLEARDITNDGNIEVISKWSDGNIDQLFLYSWRNNQFIFIAPTTTVTSSFSQITSVGYVFGIRHGDIQLKDLDRDNIDEIIIAGGVTRDEMDNEVPILGVKTIYKFNGTTYELWKEETISQ